MRLGLRLIRGLGAVGIALCGVFGAAPVVLTAPSAYAQTAASIDVQGNRRVEAATIRSYFRPGPGGRLGAYEIDEAYKTLFGTGLFQEVNIRQAGGRIIVTVVENPVINRIAFEGNTRVKDDQLKLEIQSKERGTLSRAVVQSDVQRIVEVYRRSGRYDVSVVPKIIELPNSRVDLVYEIREGSKTTISSIEFVGNRAYSSWRLKDVVRTTQTNILSFIQSTNIYDQDRLEADRELLRRFYLKNGYIDVRIVSAGAEFDPARNGFIVRFMIEEGEQYRVGTVDVRSNVRAVDPGLMRAKVRTSPGDVYNAEALEKSVEDMTIEASRQGYAFAQVRPRADRDYEAKRVNLIYTIDDGQRLYIEQINVRGNTRTRDYVIRREFDVAEGDPYNRALINRAERRLRNLGYFKEVKIATEPGSSPDRVIINVQVEEQSTGEFSIGGGYSTADGFLAEVSVGERNLLGHGLYAKASLQYGQYSSGYTLSFVEPYLLGYRLALGVDLFSRLQKPTNFVSYETRTTGGGLRLGFTLREDLSLQLRYSLFSQKIDDSGRACGTVTTSLQVPLAAVSDGLSHLSDQHGLGFHRSGNRSALYPELFPGRRSVTRRSARTRERPSHHVAGRLRPRLQHPRQQPQSDQRHSRGPEAGFRGRWRRRAVHPHDRRFPQLLRADPGRHRRVASAGRLHPRLGLPRAADAGSLPDGTESGTWLCAGRYWPPRRNGRQHAGRFGRLDVLGHERRVPDAAVLCAQGGRHQGCRLCGCRLGLELYRPDLVAAAAARCDRRNSRSVEQRHVREFVGGRGSALGVPVRAAALRSRLSGHEAVFRSYPDLPFQRRYSILSRAGGRGTIGVA